MSLEAPKLGERKAVQIVKINDEGTQFNLVFDDLNAIMKKVPEGMKVSLISVVGAFRTGKSFLLDFFLRYLRYTNDGHRTDPSTDKWMFYGSADGLEGNSNVAGESNGFSWRAGRERNTTGIWMWNEPFIRTLPDGEKVAVLVVDTQGMFDSETSQMLTASIFGLSTLLSSYQIYNVDKRIQEDNLQHLALFTEYGRMALAGTLNEEAIEKVKEEHKPAIDLEKTLKEQALPPVPKKAVDGDSKTKPAPTEEPPAAIPFQSLEFLVRDWQNFEDDEDLETCLSDMDRYLEEILSERKQKDLKNTREQINSCFQDVHCFLLPHPGFEVPKKNYDGSIEKIRQPFRILLSNYVERVFKTKLQPKKVHGRSVTGPELMEYIKAYVALFHDAKHFPEAKTLLEATAEANNRNALASALTSYKKEMDLLAGPNCKYVAEERLSQHHELCLKSVTEKFNHLANMGRKSSIKEYREEMEKEVQYEWTRYESTNRDRDPYKNIEYYVIPGLIGSAAMIASYVNHAVCFEEAGIDIPIYDCKTAGEHLGFIYWAVFTFIIVIAVTTGQTAISRAKMVFQVVTGAASVGLSGDGKQKQD